MLECIQAFSILENEARRLDLGNCISAIPCHIAKLIRGIRTFTDRVRTKEVLGH